MTAVSAQTLVLNELVSKNQGTVQDEDGDFSDWVELYNPTSNQIDLTGFSLTDDPTQLNRWTFPPFAINPGDYVLVFLSGKNRTSGPFFHTNFKLKSDGEPLLLVDDQGAVVESLTPPMLGCNVSFGRVPDASSNTGVFWGAATPWNSNDANVLIPAIQWSRPSGNYPEAFELSVTSSAELRYTLDGSIPTASSPVVSGAIQVTAPAAAPVLANVRTNPLDAPENWSWQMPGQVPQLRVVKVQAFQSGQPIGELQTRSYFIGSQFDAHGLPVLVMHLNPTDFFSDSIGIYVPGATFDTATAWLGNYDQRGTSWQRPVTVDWLNSALEAQFWTPANARINGASSRSMPMKAIRLTAPCDVRGNKNFAYEFFPDSEVDNFEHLILGTSGFDGISTHLADALSVSLIKGLGLEIPDQRPVHVFFNGEYWGVHHLRERSNRDFIESHTGEEDVDLLEFTGAIMHPDSQVYQVKAGDGVHFEELMNFVQSHDLSQSMNYAVVADKMDIDNFIDYNICKLYMATFDWPGNNVRLWRPRTPEGKWRWILVDHDDAFWKADFNAVAHALAEDGPDWPNPPWSTLLLRKLMENPVFFEKFQARVAYWLNDVFHSGRTTARLEQLKKIMEPSMAMHVERWGYPTSMQSWEDSVAVVEHFLHYRPCYLRQHLRSELGMNVEASECTYLPNAEALKVSPNPNNGSFTVGVPKMSAGTGLLQVISVTGELMYERSFESLEEPAWYQLNVQLAQGMYFVNVAQGDERYQTKMVVIQ